MSFYQSLIKVQATLNAPKGQFNSFGKYNYRSCEDIMGAVKPLLAAHNLVQFVSDEIEQVGERYYVKATVTVTDGKDSHSVSAYAREALDKKGMDSAQVTGATSSYARKYALNGMYNIDDTKDSDTNEFRQQATTTAQREVKASSIDFDGILKRATSAMSSCDMSTLKTLWTQYSSDLKASPEHLAKLTEVKNIRRTELEENK